ncbi:MAG: DUF72 domain-containing protein [Candidatus Marinimicrobia bacterium]|nr:DUF72 domain-containing protein [Candidatus Neomarinimicrobiota bacterium]MCF7851044.1 DUF72 domain-containing protein [Candidatus Neomarinimicrobiota bacterium]
MDNIHIGTCSWKYDSWEGLVYRSAKPDNYLREYAQKYNSVEIDQWFWSLFGENQVVLPKSGVVTEYKGSVPADFKFVIKVPNSLTLTHYYKKVKTDPLSKNPHFLSPDLFRRFLDSIGPLLPQVGALSFQFEYLNKQKMGSQTEFLDHLGAFAQAIESPVPICVETRNPYYLNTRYFDFLQAADMGHTFCHGYYMPDITETYETFSSQLQGTTIIRLLGRDRKGIEKTTGKQWGRVVDPQDAEIPGISRMIRKMVDQSGMDVYLNVNNHYEGSAPVTIEKFHDLLQL